MAVDSGSYTPETLLRRKAIADALARMNEKPIQHWTQGAAKIAANFLAGIEESELDEQDKRTREEANQLLTGLLGGGESPAAPAVPAAAPAAAPAGPMGNMQIPAGAEGAEVTPPGAAPVGGAPRNPYSTAIASIESGGRYDLVGPVANKGGDRAYGKYQVMGANVGPWTREVLGRELTPQQFLASPEAQEAVFNAKFGNYVQKYGPEGAARAWFAGEGGMNNPNARDVLGTTVSAYADKFNRGLGQGGPAPAAAPAQPGSAPAGAPAMAGGQPDRRAQIAALLRNPMTRGIGQQLLVKQLSDRGPQPVTVGGNLVDPSTGRVIYSAPRDPQKVSQGETLVGPDGRVIYQAPPKPEKGPAAVEEYNFYAQQERAAGREPLTFNQYQISLKEAGRPSTSVNIDQKAQGALEKTLGEGVGKIFSSMYEEGVQAGQDIAQLGRLRELMAQSGTGLGAALTNIAAGFGIKLGEGAGPGQAASAIISYLTPRQRVPGTGASSDRDLAMFKAALPNLMNLPEGNNLIIDTMQGLAEYKRAQGDIAAQVVMGEMDPKAAVAAIRALPDPFAQFKAYQAARERGGAAAQPDADGWVTINGVRIRQRPQ